MFDYYEPDEPIDFDNLPSLKDMVDNFQLSPYNQAHLEDIPLETQMSLRTQALKTVETILSEDEDAINFVEKSLYDLFLSVATGRHALMFQAFATVSYYAGGIQTAWEALEKHGNDISALAEIGPPASGKLPDTASLYLINVLKAYENQLDDMVVLCAETSHYFREESPDKSIIESLRLSAPVLVGYKTHMLPAIDYILSEILDD